EARSLVDALSPVRHGTVTVPDTRTRPSHTFHNACTLRQSPVSDTVTEALRRRCCRELLGLAEELDEDLDQLRVELRAGAALDLGHRVVVAERSAVRAVARHRVEGVRDREHARLDRDLLARAAGRIARAVPAL